MKRASFQFIVRVTLTDPRGDRSCAGNMGHDPNPREEPASEALVRGYVLDAVKSWGGQTHPAEPVFPSNLTVTVGLLEPSVRSLAKRYASTLDDKHKDETYTTSRKLARQELEGFLQWLIKGGKKHG